jgi:predicted trehalose synthase
VTAVAFEAERWYADKGRPVASLEVVDALGPLTIVRVLFRDGHESLYTLVPKRPDWSPLIGAARGRFGYEGEAPSGAEEPLAVDQSHSSWRVGSAYLKCYRRLMVGSHPEVELLRALGERGFAHAPAYRGVLQWESPSGEAVALAVVTEFLEDGEEGWEWAAELAGRGDASFAQEVGAVARRLHETLAAALGAREATVAETDAWRRTAEEQLTRALVLVPELREHEGRAWRELARLASPAEVPLLSRVHGDLHVGQFLRAGDRVVVVDFEGQPGKSADERRRPDTPLRDLASLSRSLDHCGRYAVKRRGADPDRTESWIAQARERLLAGYGRCDRELLRALEWERAIYEFTYAATYLPEWMYAPRGGLNALLRDAET